VRIGEEKKDFLHGKRHPLFEAKTGHLKRDYSWSRIDIQSGT
jgi:hypothetical protein